MKYQKLYIWGPNQFANRLLASQIKELADREPVCICDDDEVGKVLLDQHCIVFCDCDKKDVNSYCTKLERSAGLNGNSPSIALLNVDAGRDLTDEVIRFGIQGIFYSDDKFDNITKGLGKILEGECWLSRDLLVQSLEMVRKQAHHGGNKINSHMLTKREVEILQLIVVGFSNHDIAEKLFISTNTVKTHVSNLYKKIDVTNRVQAILWATEYLDNSAPQIR